MRKSRALLPVWVKIVLVFLLLVTLISVSATAYFRFEHRTAAAKETLPSLMGYRYCAVTDWRWGSKYAVGSLLLIQPQEEYQPGDEVVARTLISDGNGVSPEYRPVQLDVIGSRKYRGKLIGWETGFAAVAPGEIVGRVTHITPVLGTAYALMTGPMGCLMFMLGPAAMLALWIAVMAWLSSRKRAERERREMLGDLAETLPSEPKRKRSRRRDEEPEPFDLFEEASPESEADEPAPVAAPAPEPVAEPVAEPAPAPQPAAPEADVEQFAPAYLYRDVDQTLDQLRRNVRQEESRRKGSMADAALGTVVADLDQEWQRCLDQINSFDPDAAIAEIKRQNALYENDLRK